MKNMNYLFLLFFILYGTSCSEENISEGYSISTAVKISVVDQQGSDLLDPDNENNLKSENIKIFHMIDGELTEFSEGYLDYPKGFLIYNPYDLGFNEQYLFCLLATDASASTGELESLLPVTYIQWNETDMDTVKCQYYQTDNILECTKVWFNGVLVWTSPGESGEGRWFQIFK
jgi:hypothetical protein